MRLLHRVLALGLVLLVALPAAAERVRLVTYNVENYLLAARGGREVKPEAARAKVAEILAGLRPDIIALQELGGPAALEDLGRRLQRLGLEYPHRELVQGYDKYIQGGLLSRHPIVERRPHTRDNFPLSGRRCRVSRCI